MAFTAAQLEAILTLDKSQFDRSLSQAERSAHKTGQGFKQWGSGVGKAINDGVVLAATGAAGFAAAVTSVGVEYNALQQSSRAALDTIMGGLDKANAQMDKLDQFASNSPFAKDVFIKAQQQLLGFGMEAERVIPTLDAIQNAVAATGGSNEDIAELTRIIAQLEGGVKLSAETLNQFGVRGIDAAELIGSAMGKTGAQIREEITSGTIDADVAIQALTDGMAERFDGAAANVKETWVGAMDRVKAATRDIGAEIARPFVDPNGGGRAVDWANDFADVLRAVERQVPSLVTALDNRLSPSFDRFRITMKDAVDTIDGWDSSDLEGILDRLGKHAPAIAGLSAAMFTMATTNIPVIGGLTSALGPLPAAIGAAALASPGMRDGLKDIFQAGEPLIGTLIDLAGVASGTFTTALEGAGTVLGGVADIIGPVVQWFADLPEPVRNAATAALIFNAAGRPMAGYLTNMGGGVRNLLSQFNGWAGTFQGAGNSLGDFRAAVGLVAGDLGHTARQGLRGALHGITGIFGGPWGIAIMGATALVTLWAQEQQKAKERADELAASLDEQTGAFTAASEEILASQVLEKIKETQDGVGTFAGELETYGLTVGDITAAIIDQGDAHEYLKDKIIEANMGAAGVSDEAAARRLAENAEVWEYVEEQIEAHRLEQEAIEAVREAEKERFLAMDEGERSHERYKESIRQVTDETINMSDRVRALNDALDELHGETKTQEERDRELAGTQRDLNSWFRDNAEAIEEMDVSLIDMSTGMPGHTELGDQLEGMLSRMGNSAHTAALEIYDLAEAEGWSTEKTQEAIAEAYEPYIATLRDLEEQGYLTGDEVDALTNSIIGVPEITAFLITHNDSVTQTERDVINLASQIEATPDGETFITDNETIQGVRDELEDLGYEVRTLDNGEVEVVPIGIPEAVERIKTNLTNRNWSATVSIRTLLTGKTLQQQLEEARRGGPGWGVVAPRYYGGIDIKGMAAGGLTGPSVMDIAQMVKPGDIRFAGDRSDVDEAWIPLDGSTRSIAILQEAMARMPNFDAEGMSRGGISAYLNPPEIEAVGGPDTSELEGVWDDAMAALEDSTRESFQTIGDDTASAQEASTASTRANMTEMLSIMAAHLSLMAEATASNMASMESDTSSHTGGMERSAAANFLAMQQTGSEASSLLRSSTGHHFRQMHVEAAEASRGLRRDSNEEFTSLRIHGVDSAADLRSGVVSEIAQAKAPFLGRVNDLVEVMQDFSKALNDAYGDMGIDVGRPSKISASTGVILPGWNPGVDNHVFHSPTGGILELSGGEGVARPEVVQALGAGTFMQLNAAAASGGTSGVLQALSGLVPRQSFSTGGIMGEFTADADRIGREYRRKLPQNWVRPVGENVIDGVVDGIGDALAASFDGAGWVRPTVGRVTSPYGAGRGAYPHSGMDIAHREGTRVDAPTAAKVVDTGWNIGPGRTGLGILLKHLEGLFSYYGHNPVGGVKVQRGDLVMPGQQIGAQGNTGNSTGAHLHWEVHKGRPWADVDPMPYWQQAGGGASVLPASLLANLGAGTGTDGWASTIKMALRLNGLPTTPAYVSPWLRQVQTESGGNPRAIQQVHDINSRMGNHARGLLQVIPPTFNAYKFPGMGDIFNPLHNAAAAMNYSKNRYGVAGMLRVIGQGHGYEHGTESALPGWAWVGEAGPELMRFKGGETVKPHRESVRMASAHHGGLSERDARRIAHHLAQAVGQRAGLVNHGTITVFDERDLVRRLDRREAQTRRLRPVLR